MNNVLQIPTEYNMQKSLLNEYELIKKDNERLRIKVNRLIVQKRFWFFVAITSLVINLALIYFIIDGLFTSIRLAG